MEQVDGFTGEYQVVVVYDSICWMDYYAKLSNITHISLSTFDLLKILIVMIIIVLYDKLDNTG